MTNPSHFEKASIDEILKKPLAEITKFDPEGVLNRDNFVDFLMRGFLYSAGNGALQALYIKWVCARNGIEPLELMKGYFDQGGFSFLDESEQRYLLDEYHRYTNGNRHNNGSTLEEFGTQFDWALRIDDNDWFVKGFSIPEDIADPSTSLGDITPDQMDEIQDMVIRIFI